jgi:hypothetical protein
MVSDDQLGNFLSATIAFARSDSSLFWGAQDVELRLDNLASILSTEFGQTDLFDLQNATFDCRVLRTESGDPFQRELFAHMPNPVQWSEIAGAFWRALGHGSCRAMTWDWGNRDWTTNRMQR